MKRPNVLGVGALALCALVGAVLVLTAQVPPGKLPGLVSADPFAKGCVDCHKVQPDGKDTRINVLLKQVPKHPDISAIVKNVPTDCGMCHKAGAAAGPIANSMHKQHFAAKGNSAFVKTYGGECLNCHTMDATTFAVKVKSALKNW